MKTTHPAIGIFWLLVGLVFSAWSMTYPVGRLRQPGPGLFPFLLGLLLILFALILLKRSASLRWPEEGAKPFFLPGGWKRVGSIGVILLFATFAFESIGYLLTFFFLLVALMWRAGLKSWRIILLTAFFATLGIYVVFVLLLNQPLPRGFLEMRRWTS